MSLGGFVSFEVEGFPYYRCVQLFTRLCLFVELFVVNPFTVCDNLLCGHSEPFSWCILNRRAMLGTLCRECRQICGYDYSG